MPFLDQIDGLPALGPRGRAWKPGQSITTEALEDSILAGEELHDSIIRLAWRGYDRARLEELLHRSAARTERPERWREALESDIPRALESAPRKREAELARRLGVPTVPGFAVADAHAPDGLHTFSAATLHGQDVPRQRWLAKDLIPEGQPSLISGDGGLGKSLLALDLAAAVALGGLWLDRYVSTGPALYLSAEDETAELHRRLSAIVARRGVGLDRLADLHVAPLAELDALLAVPSSGALTMTPLWDALARRVEELRPVLVVLDSLADVFGGNEVVRSEVRWFVGQLRKLCHRTGCTIAMLAHPSLSGMATGSGLSGSTHWNNAVRSRLYLTRPEGDDADQDMRVLEVKKNNRAALGRRIELRWEAGVFVAVDGGEASPFVDADVDALFLELLARLTSERRYVNAQGGSTYAPAVFAGEDEARARRVSKKTLTAAMKRLLRERRIIVATRRVSGHERTFLEVAPLDASLTLPSK